MKTRIVSIAILVSCSNLLFAQSIWKGSVTNEENQAVRNAVVFDENQSKIAVSDENGRISLPVSVKTPVHLVAKGYETLYDTIFPNLIHQKFMLVSTREELEEIQIKATRASSQTPTTFTNLNKKEIDEKNFGQDLPYLLDGTLSTVVSSDAGAGIGYTNLRIRGVDPTGTNITINGIQVNDAESQNVFWVNMPDFASSVNDIQIQRGVGTSSNGGAAFGASINIKTDKIQRNPFMILDNSYGSFNTWKNSISAGTGVINNHFYMNMRLSNITSDGYIDRGSSNLKSFYTSGAWFNSKSMLQFDIFGGKERTYQAWNGVPESRLKGDIQGMLDYASRNGLSAEETDNLLNSSRSYNYFTYRNQTDNYNQTHYQLHFSHRFNEHWKLNLSAHYTRGIGYYEEYKNDQDLTNYKIAPVIINVDTIAKSDLIRQKWLDNHFYGVVYNLNYSKGNWSIDYGGGINQYLGNHYGDVIWARFASNSEIDHRYYFDKASKIDFNNFVKINYRVGKSHLFADLQLRNINYVFEGISDLAEIVNSATQKANYVFFNPKIGWNYEWNDKNNSYISIAVANREPIRKDFTENLSTNRPKPETLYDLEIGNRFNSNKWKFNIALYMMYYHNQLVFSGQINDVGGDKRINVPQSYRAGIEMEASYSVAKWFRPAAGFTFSQNKVLHLTEYITDYDNNSQLTIEHNHTNLALSPDLIASFGLNFIPLKNFNLLLNGKYISRQFLDNTSNLNRSIDGYYVMNLNMSYLLKLPKIQGIEFGLQINNLLNTMYANNGYTYGYYSYGQMVRENFYFPQAGINLMGRIKIMI